MKNILYGNKLVISFLKKMLNRVSPPDSKEYWEKRYANGGTSGDGSYGQLSEFKADILNRFVEEKGIQKILEFGCGDGNQLLLANYPKYIGLDVSKTAILMCKNRFKDDKSKSFFLYDSDCFIDQGSLFKSDIALSLDVIYHLVEDEIFENYMTHLFASAEKYVIIYSCDYDSAPSKGYVRKRCFTHFVDLYYPEWRLKLKIPNRFPFDEKTAKGSWSDFYFYEKVK